jgi:hypothetical protein
MNKNRRKPFFIKRNFRLTFIIGFIALLFIEVILTGVFIYKLSAAAVEKEAFRSHISINKSSQITGPIVLKVNVFSVIISIILAGIIVTVSYYRNRNLFDKIIEELENLRDNNLSFRIDAAGGKKARELINEFNAAASYFEQRGNNLQAVLDKLIAEKELENIEKLHNKLSSILTENDSV